MSTQSAKLAARWFCDARSRYLNAVEDLEGDPDHDLSLAQVVIAAKHGLEYDLASQAQASAYLSMLASVDGAPSDYFRALSQALRMEFVSSRPWPQLAAVEAAIKDLDQTLWILDEIESAEAADFAEAS